MSDAVFGLSPEIVRSIAWLLIQFVWQALGLAGVMELILRNCREAPARHNWAFRFLILILMAPAATFLGIYYHIDFVPASMTVEPTTGVGVATALSGLMTSRWLDWMIVGWFAGILALTIRAIGGWYLANKLRRRNVAAIPDALWLRCETMKQRFELWRAPHFLQSTAITSPMVVGWLQPTVLVPSSAISGMPAHQLEALIVHELAHIRRSDAFINIILVAAETIFFFHPAVWWVTRRIRIERELCCDDVAVSVLRRPRRVRRRTAVPTRSQADSDLCARVEWRNADASYSAACWCSEAKEGLSVSYVRPGSDVCRRSCLVSADISNVLTPGYR